MNITAFEYEDSIIIVDCGLAFPEDDMLGIDLVIPDVTYLKENIEKVKGFVITHATVRSDIVNPWRNTLVLSHIKAKTPFLPSSPKRCKSIVSPIRMPDNILIDIEQMKNYTDRST